MSKGRARLSPEREALLQELVDQGILVRVCVVTFLIMAVCCVDLFKLVIPANYSFIESFLY